MRGLRRIRLGGFMLRYTFADRVFLAVNFLVLTCILVILIYPLLYVISSSFSGGVMLGGGLSLIPKQFSVEGYRAIADYQYVWTGYRNSIVYTVVGTSFSMICTVFAAYPLSRQDFIARKWIMGVFIFTMYFSGGLIPTFLWVRNLGLLDSMWALILPTALSVYNMIVMRTYFKTQIPQELLDAAQIDGCGEWLFLLKIVIPLSTPILAVISLYYAVGLWNSYFWAMVYMRTTAKLPLANILREILFANMTVAIESSMNSEAQAMLEKRAEIMKYSLMMISSVPVLLMYPFVQKYFVKGMMIGAVKG